MNYFPEGKRQKRSEKIMQKIKTLARNEKLSCQNKLDFLSALCSKEMALEILRKAFKKGYSEFHIYGNTSLNS